jgi:predicted AAA+ superfamily ATPase
MLPPLTFAEYLQFIGLENELITVNKVKERGRISSINHYTCKDIPRLNEEFIRYLNFGGYPEAVFSTTIQHDPAQYIKSDIIDKVLLRDLPSLYGITDIQELNRLFTVLAYNSGNEVSLEALSKSAGVAKNTIKRYLEYLEAAFLIKRVDRIDQTAKRFKRAMCFKAYLTNPSMRAALFGQITADAETIGHLIETAIFSQWQHSDSVQLYYARWNSGEIDIVHLNSATQSPTWAVEVKWSDRPVTDTSLLRHCVEFAKTHPKLQQPILCTTRTYLGTGSCQDVLFKFQPSSLYAYTLGANLLNHKNLPLVDNSESIDSMESDLFSFDELPDIPE